MLEARSTIGRPVLAATRAAGIALCLAALTLASAPARFAGRAQKAARVTEVRLSPDEARSAGPCPVSVSFRGHITTDRPGTVTYTFTRSDGAVGPTLTLEFKEAGTQAVSTTWTLGDAQSSSSYEGWLAVRVLSPNEVESSREAGRFVVTCGAAPAVSAAGAPGRLTEIIPDTPSYATSVNPPHTPQPTIYVAELGTGGKVSAFRDMDGSGYTELRAPPAGTFAALAGDYFTATDSVAIDPAGRIYVGDEKRIVRVDDMSGANWRSLGGFHSVSGIFVDSAYRIYVADAKGSEIVRFDDMDGSGRVTLRGRGDQRLLLPASVTVDDAGRIYITDTGNHRIVRVDDMTGAGWVSCCGPPPDPKTGLVPDTEQLLSFPRGIALDARGRIYVTTNPTSAPLFDAEGTPAYEIGFNRGGPEVAHYSVVRIDDMTGVGRVSYSRQIGHYERGDRTGVNQFALPVSIALDNAGRIYVADYGNSRITRIDDLTGAGWVVAPPFNCIRASIPNCTPRNIVVSDVRRPGALPPPEDLSPVVYITSTPGTRARGSSDPLPFDLFSPVVRAVISEDVGLRSVSVQLDDGPLMPMPFSRDPEDGTLYHGQLREVRPSPTAALDPFRVHTLRVVATDTAGHTSEDLRQFQRRRQ